MSERGYGLTKHNREYEKAALGVAIRSENCRLIMLTRLTKDHFYRPNHQNIFCAIKYLSDNQLDVNQLTVHQEALRLFPNSTLLEKEILELDERAYPAALETYLKTIEKDYQDREHRKETLRLGDLLDIEHRTDDQEAEIQTRIEALTNHRPAHAGFATFGQIITRDESRPPVPEEDKISTGFADIDEVMGRLLPSTYVAVGARTSVGKTLFETDLLVSAVQNGVPALCFNMELSDSHFVNLLICKLAKLGWKNFLSGNLTEDEKIRLRIAKELVKDIKNLEINTMEKSSMTIEEAAAKAVLFFKKQQRPGLLFLDNLQLLKPSFGEIREQEVAHFSHGVHRICLQTGCVAIALSQLNREASDREPELSDYRESGAIEQDCDIGILLYRPFFTNRKKHEFSETWCLIKKNRKTGGQGNVELFFDLDHVTFRPVDHKHEF